MPRSELKCPIASSLLRAIDDTVALVNTLGGGSQSPKTASAALGLKQLAHTCSFSHLY